jgi:hypothetical protein
MKVLSNNFSNTAGNIVHGDFHVFRAASTSNKPTFRWEMIQIGNDGTTKPITGAASRNVVQDTTHIRFFTNGGTTTGFYEIWGE